MANPVVEAANQLTRRWCEALGGDRSFVVSGAGAWPLVALLLSTAGGTALAELEAAAGRPRDGAQADALALLELLDGADGVAAALGLWVRETVPLRDDWTTALPAGVVGTLSGGPRDQMALDAWARRKTDGLIERMPVTIDASVLLLLATALVARTTWREPFQSGSAFLHRVSTDLGQVRAGDQTRVVVAGTNDLDVHLIISPDGPVTLFRDPPARSGADLAVGDTAPGLRVTEATWGHPAQDRVFLMVPPFDLRSSHDLIEHADVFGIATALDDERGHFPGLSPLPLAVSQAAQDARATFSEEGFEAAAVTAFAMQAGAAPRQSDRPFKQVEVRCEPPFGFLAVHRPSGLVVAAGWIAVTEDAAMP